MVHRTRGMPGIAMVWGKVGLGKTTATRHVCLVEDAIWVEAQDQWTPRWMTADIAEELGAPRARYTEDNFRAILAMLREHPRAIFIDEADRLVRRLYLTETLRAIHDQTQAPLILIGMSQLPRAIKSIPQLESRIAHRVEFQPCDLRDVRTMAETMCEIEPADDLIRELHRVTIGSARTVRIALERLENHARRRAQRKLKLGDLPDDFALMPDEDHPVRREARRDDARSNDSSNVVALRTSEGVNA
jgi:DNA transposition AAA+ family ATPase